MDYFKFPNVIVSGGSVICYGSFRLSPRKVASKTKRKNPLRSVVSGIEGAIEK